MSDINRERAEAVRGAWKNERALVQDGKGTRDWPQRQQIGMVRKGVVSGFDGHHMQSVKTHPQQAGNPKNIQFLNKSEHIKGAHGGNTKNSTNGYYNPQTKSMHSFGSNSPQAPQIQLNKPLSQNQIYGAMKREQNYQNRVTRDMSIANQWRQTHGYTPAFKRTQSQNSNLRSINKGIESMKSKSVNRQIASQSAQNSQNKGIEAVRQKSSIQQSGTKSAQTVHSANKGIASYQNKVSRQTANISKSSSSGGQSSGRGQGR
jgi:hypothetical protein